MMTNKSPKSGFQRGDARSQASLTQGVSEVNKLLTLKRFGPAMFVCNNLFNF